MTCCFFSFFRSSFRPLAMATYLDPRISSNKENSPPSSIALNDIDAISLSLRTSLSGVTPPPKKKTAALGLGRAPKFTYRRHSNKPYNRSTSITRAKKAAVKSKSVRPKAAIKKSKTRPPPLKLVQGPDVESAKLARLERLRRAVWHPPAPVPGQVKVPLKLPYPRFPSFEYIDNEYLKEIVSFSILDERELWLTTYLARSIHLRPHVSSSSLLCYHYPCLPTLCFHSSPRPQSLASYHPRLCHSRGCRR